MWFKHILVIERGIKNPVWKVWRSICLYKHSQGRWNMDTLNTDKKSCYHKISAEKAHQMMCELPCFHIIDVRTRNEFQESHIKGAILIPCFEIASSAELRFLNKELPVFIYCKGGTRSRCSAENLVQMGFTKVYDIGGIIDWPYETEAENISCWNEN